MKKVLRILLFGILMLTSCVGLEYCDSLVDRPGKQYRTPAP